MTGTIPFLPGLSPVAGKELCARFDGGRLSSDGGVLLLHELEHGLGLADALASCLRDDRGPSHIRHSHGEMIRARMFAIACGYEDCDDLDSLRMDPAFKLACGRLSESGDDLMSQPTLSRLENAPSWRAFPGDASACIVSIDGNGGEALDIRPWTALFDLSLEASGEHWTDAAELLSVARFGQPSAQ